MLLFDYTDAELIEHITSLPHLHNFSNVIPLSFKYLAKGYTENELEDAVRATTFASQLRRVIHCLRYSFTRFRTARRFDMKANGYAAAAARVDSDL